jgi:phospholipid-binding lipoprotein MlaA
MASLAKGLRLRASAIGSAGSLIGLLLIFGASNAAAASSSPTAGAYAGEYQPVESDPLAPFNEKMFWFNLKLDTYVVRPVAQGYASVVPEPARQSVERFFRNVSFIPRFANNLFQLRFTQAGGELARFGINTTLGVGGLFDVADSWFGLQENPDDFGLTIRHYSIPTGPYLVLPFFGPSTIGDTIGLAADGSMNPLVYLTPWEVYLAADGGEDVAWAINYRSLNLNLFEDVDRYAVDLYGAVQDGYRQRRAARTKELAQ